MTLLGRTINYKQLKFKKVRGRVIPLDPIDSTFNGTVQPATGKDLESFEIGPEDKGFVKIYSDTQLNVSIQGSDNSGDIVIWQNKEWKVIKELEYQNNLLSHYKYMARFEGDIN